MHLMASRKSEYQRVQGIGDLIVGGQIDQIHRRRAGSERLFDCPSTESRRERVKEGDQIVIYLGIEPQFEVDDDGRLRQAWTSSVCHRYLV